MHELAAMQDIIERINREAKIKGAKKIIEAKIVIGKLRGLSRKHFLNDWKMLTRGTWLESADLDIKIVNPQAQCRKCGRKLLLNKFSINCPFCGAAEIEITSGKELLLESVTVE